MMSTLFIITSILQLVLVQHIFANDAYHTSASKIERTVQSTCTTVIGRTNQIYENSVSKDKPISYVFYVDKKYFQWSHVSAKTTNLRVESGTDQATSLQFPIMFAVRQQQYISTFEVPSHFSDADEEVTTTSIEDVYYYGSRTLCIADYDEPQGRNITVRVTTHSTTTRSFYLILKLTEDFQLPLGETVSIDVSPTAPKFFGFSFGRPDVSTVSIRAISNTIDCVTLSVQTFQCPIYDSEHNVRFKGLWQTMSTTAAMSVEKTGRYSQGFVIVLVAHRDNEVCGRKVYSSTNSSRTYGFSQMNFSQGLHIKDSRAKTIKLLIKNESKAPHWIILLSLFLPIFGTFLIGFAVLALFQNRHKWIATSMCEYEETMKLTRTLQTPEPNGTTDENGQDNHPENIALNMLNSDISRKSSIGGNNKKGVWTADLNIADFNCRGFKEVKRFSKRFYWTIGIVAIFYSIPVYQLVIHYLRVLYRTGEFDICYYNYLCAHRLGVLIDFNHFWSNASYVIFGILFIGIVRRRDCNLVLNSEKESNENLEESCCPCSSKGKGCLVVFSRISFRWNHGVPAHFGVFYALGVALLMEGFLSAAYHLCPNQSTFQFDTCFMYVIAVLLLLKIYQFRHPVHFGANQTFAILAGFVIISVLGLMFERGQDKAKLIFKCIFLPCQYIIMVLIAVYYYAVGYVRNACGELVTDWDIYGHLAQLKQQPLHRDRLFLPLTSFLICIAVLVYSELSNMEFASYLLYILVGNVLGTTFVYVGIMKPLHGEFKNRTWVQPTLYFLSAGVIGGFSLQYFVRAPAKWELSASASRAGNEDCLNSWFPFHPFYDSHDAWHFLSAASLFLTFMGLLIVDDDLITTPQTKIPIF